MLGSVISSALSSVSAGFVTDIVCSLILIAFVFGLLMVKKERQPDFVGYAPALLTSLGIFGTFVGIVIGLLAFNPANIDDSIADLLAGLQTAFVTSLLGILLSILFKILQPLLRPKQLTGDVEVSDASPETILASMERQSENITLLVQAIGGEKDSSLLSQLKLLRSDINDGQQVNKSHGEQLCNKVSSLESLAQQRETLFAEFESKLWVKLQDFSDVLSKSATETVIEALKQVITDFNQNLTEQFGENFKELNIAVKELVVWQNNYKNQMLEMTDQYALGVKAINATELSVANISEESKVIPKTMIDLKEIMDVNQHQLKSLEQHLEAFKDIRDRAVEAVPEIRKQIDETVKSIADSVEVANTHYKTLLSESDTYIQSHISASNELLNKFVENTNDGVKTIGEKLHESAQSVEKVLLEGAANFGDNVKITNESLQDSANHVTSQTQEIKEVLNVTVTELNNTVRDMINGLNEDAKKLFEMMATANNNLNTDTNNARESVVNSIDQMQSKLTHSLDDVFEQQSQYMQKVFNNIDAGLKEQVGKTGAAVEKQLSTIDHSMQTEIEHVMNSMGQSLGQISNQFTNDYVKLVGQMQQIVNEAKK